MVVLEANEAIVVPWHSSRKSVRRWRGGRQRVDVGDAVVEVAAGIGGVDAGASLPTTAPVTGKVADAPVSDSPHGPAHLERLAIGVVPSTNPTFPGQGCCPRVRGPDSARRSTRTRTERAPAKTQMR
jgi:hypothetical protein